MNTKPRYPQLPVQVGKARQKLSQAIITGDDDLATWIRYAIDTNQITGPQHRIRELETRLNEVTRGDQE